MLAYLVICFALLSPSFAVDEEPTYRFLVGFQWNYINYTWPSEEAYSAAKSDGSYVEKNNIISGIKVWKDRMYLTVPRYRKGIPVTLAVTSATPLNNQTSPLFEPYPDWDMQKIGNCNALQNVRNVEIDPKGRMWVLDSGRVATMTTEPQNNCPAKLLILDVENSAKVLRSYDFPKEVVNNKSGILGNIVLDHEHGGVAYITDLDMNNPGIVVYSLANNTSRKVSHESMYYVPDDVGFVVGRTFMSGKINVNGIALSPASHGGEGREVYFSPMTSLRVYVVKTQALIDAKDKEGEERKQEIGKHIHELGRRASQSDGMTMSNSGKLFYGLLANDTIVRWNSKAGGFDVAQKVEVRDHFLMEWPANIAFDDENRLWVIANRFHNYVHDSVDITRPNYRAIKSKRDGERSYQYLEDGKAPEWPDIKVVPSTASN